MYIPTMAFITYILLAGLSLGTEGQFKPEVLGEIMSAAIGWVVLEVLLTIFALFVIQVIPYFSSMVSNSFILG